jgi:NAD(P)-dependent dehydrogenase (short-subunit alcohol dehydrogenase family)
MTQPRSNAPLVLITGTSSGIGLAVALMLARSGWQVVGTQRSAGRLDDVDVRLMDVTSEAAVNRCVHEVLNDYGRIDAVVNNAGAGHVATLEDDSLDDIKRVFDVNFFGVVRVTRACLPALRASRGRLVTVTSVGGVIGQPFNDAYCAAKFAVEGLLESLAPVLRGAGVRVSVVEPGFVHTQFVANLDATTVSAPYEAMRERYVATARSRMSYGQQPDEVAAVIQAVLNEPNPKFRYQTSEGSAAFVKTKLADTTGDIVQQLTGAWIGG